MQADLGGEWSGEPVIRVDGGMSTSDWTMQFLTDILAAPVDWHSVWRRPLSAPDTWPAWRLACIRILRRSRRAGQPNGVSNRR
jgi:hypothetical protein